MIFRSLWYDRWINLAVMLGVVCATAVLTGALLVGDSMRGSLKALTLDRLGNIDTILQGSQFFTPPDIALEHPWTKSEAVILLPAAVEANGKVSGAQLLGNCDLRPQNVIVNEILAERLNVKSGDRISLRFNSLESIPPDSPLGRRTDTLIRAQLTVKEVIPNTGLGRFSLKADQQAEPLAIVPLDWLQRRLDVGEKVNAVFFRTDHPETVSTAEDREKLVQRFQPTLNDLGIIVEDNYVKSARMLFTKPQAEAIQNSLPESEPVLVYLATKIRAVKNDRETPYSTVCAVSRLALRGVQSAAQGAAANDSLALNQWTVDDLDVQLGDEIELTWFEPESVHGQTVETSQVFTLTAILPMDGIGCDPKLVPDVKGFTDEISIADWNPPFPFDARRIRKKDEDYWDKYRAAPKAFVPLEIGQKLWGSRFGSVTTFILASDAAPGAAQGLRPGLGSVAPTGRIFSPVGAEYNSPGRKPWATTEGIDSLPYTLFGLNFVPAKAQGLLASSGTTPFSVLFLSFSFFIIAAALMLVLMLFRLSVEIKAKRIGILLAAGWTRRRVARSLIGEGMAVAMIGSLLGTLFGIFYARLMVYGLTTWWVDAITVPFLRLYVTPSSLVVGFSCGVVLSALTILASVRGVTKIQLWALLHGDTTPHHTENKGSLRVITRKLLNNAVGHSRLFAWVVFCVAMFVIWLYCFFEAILFNHMEYGFFAAVLILCAGLWAINESFYKYCEQKKFQSLVALARANATRNQRRSLLFIALISSTTFLVLSISAFHLQPDWFTKNRTVYMGETMFPVYVDISTPEGREQLSIQPDDEKYLATESKWKLDYLFSFRMRDGDSASCLNLYQTDKPRVLGTPRKFHDYAPGFYFTQSVELQPEERGLWAALCRPITMDADGIRRVPIILDSNTAMYSLHLYGGVGEVYELDIGQGESIRCEIIGLLSDSIFQGEILMSEVNFLQLFPEVGGYRYFLFGINYPYYAFEFDDRTLRIIYDLLGDYGFQGESTSDRLRKLFAIQNTYLSTFQSLGGIGLLLGVFGLAVIQSRNVLERRKELALLQAVGFAKSRVILLLLYESFTLLGWGLGLAVLASAFALFPFLIGGVQQVSALSVLQQFVVLVGGLTAVGVVSNVAAALAVLKIPVARELAEER